MNVDKVKTTEDYNKNYDIDKIKRDEENRNREVNNTDIEKRIEDEYYNEEYLGKNIDVEA